MIFERFLRDAIEAKGVTQKQLGDKVYLSSQAISNYILNKRQCSFDLGMTLLSALGIAVIIENNEIKLLKGDLKMEKNYINNMEFVNFNVEDFVKEVAINNVNAEKDAKERFAEAYKKLDEQGYNVRFGINFSEKYFKDENYDSDTLIATFTKEGKSMSLVVDGYNDIDIFVLERFVKKIAEENDELAKFVFKSIVYTVHATDCGSSLYDALQNQDKKAIISLIPMLSDNIDAIMRVLSDNHDYLFSNISCGFCNEDLTISEYLRIYDSSSNPYLYFLYEMEDGEMVYSKESFEGHDIDDAFMYVDEYFKDLLKLRNARLFNCRDVSRLYQIH